MDNELRARAPDQGVVAHRSKRFAGGRASWLIVASGALAIAGAVLAVESSPDHLFSMVVGLGLFVAGAAVGVASAASLTRAATGATVQSRHATSGDAAQAVARGFVGSASMQLGPDPEQVIGRHTGART
jgi:drug/metabolite transporter (DMT)-like permease